MCEVQVKEPTSIDQQIELLASRGCLIEDESFCADVLSSIKYYRLSAYFLPFRGQDNHYLPDTSFLRVFHIYEFDRKLRRILFSAIEEIEIYLRAHLSDYLALKYGPECYTDCSVFNTRHDHERFTDKYKAEIKNNENVLFVKHHLETYDGHFPIWVLTELFTFGMLSHLFSDLKTADQKYFSTTFFSTNYQVLKSRLRCCTDLRNICAHYGRLYYRIFSAVPAGYTNSMTNASASRLWGALNVIKDLYPDGKKWNEEYMVLLRSLFDQYSNDISLYHIAFPDDWYEQLKNDRGSYGAASRAN